MKLKVTEQGVVIPKALLEGIDEIEIRQEDGQILLIPIFKIDPILELGKNPVECGVTDASEHHDKYLHNSAE